MGRLETLLRSPLGLSREPGNGDAPRSAIVGSLAVSGGQVAVGVLFALASLYLVRSFDTAEYGRVAVAIYIYTLLQAIASLGLGSGVLAEVARGRHANSVAWTTVHSLLWVRLASVAPVILIGAVWAALAGDIVPLMASVLASIAVLAEFLIGILAGQLRTRAYVVVVVGQPVVYLLLLVVLEVRTAELALIVLGVALGISLLLGVAILGRGPVARVGRPRATLSELAHALNIAGSSYVLGAISIGFIAIPIIVLGSLERFVEAASLSIVLTLVRFAPEALGLGVQAAYFPRVKAVDPTGGEATALFGTFARVLALLAVPAAFGLAVFGQQILSVLFGDQYADLAVPLAIACALVVLLPAESLLTWTLIARREHRAAVLGTATRLGVVLLACLVLITASGASALFLVPWASVVGAAVSVLVQGVRTHQTGSLAWPAPRIAAYALLAAAVYIAIGTLLDGRVSDLAMVVAAAAVTIPVLAAGVALLLRTSSAATSSSASTPS